MALSFPSPIPVSDVEKQLEGLSSMVCSQFRKVLSIEQNSSIEEDILSTVPQFVEFLTMEDSPQLQFLAAWALTKIASGTSEATEVVIRNGAVPFFVKLMCSSPNDDVREQAVCALGIFAGDSPKGRDLVLSNGALTPLLDQFDQLVGNAKISKLRNAAWTLSNLCKGEFHEPEPPFQKVRPALKTLQNLVHYEDDEEVLTYACRALSYLSNGADNQIDAIIEAGVCPGLVALLGHHSPTVLIPVLETVGNIVNGEDTQIQVILDNGALGYLMPLLTENPNESIKKVACFIISNITAGNEKQIQAVIEAHFIGPLVKLLQTAECDVMMKYAANAICNASSRASCKQIMYLVDEGCIEALCHLLVSNDQETVLACLKSLGILLVAGQIEMERCYIDVVERLGNTKNSKVAEEALYLRDILEGRLPDFSPDESKAIGSNPEELLEDTEEDTEDDTEDDVLCFHSMPLCPQRSYLSGTSIMGLKSRGIVILVADSRSWNTRLRAVESDSTIKLHWITKSVYAADCGDRDINFNVLLAARDYCSRLGDDNDCSLKSIANHVARLRTLVAGKSSYIIGGRVRDGQEPRMFHVRAADSPSTSSRPAIYVHKAHKSVEVFDGAGEPFMRGILQRYPDSHRARGVLGEALPMIKAAMHYAKRRSDKTGGPINLVVITNDGEQFFQSQPLDPEDKNSSYGQWVEDGFVPRGR